MRILHSKSAYAGLLLNEGVHSMEQCSATCENNSSVYNICSQFRRSFLKHSVHSLHNLIGSIPQCNTDFF